jgi:hypothetical protein
MKHLKYSLFIVIAFVYPKLTQSQHIQVINAGNDSCVIANKNDTFLIKVAKGNPEENKDYYSFNSFKDSCYIKFNINKIGFIKEFKSLDINHKLDSIADKMSSMEPYSYSIKKINQPISIDKAPLNNIPETTTTNDKNKNWYLLLLIIPLALILVFRKNIGAFLMPKDKPAIAHKVKDENINDVIPNPNSIPIEIVQTEVGNYKQEIDVLKKEIKLLLDEKEEFLRQDRYKDNEIDKLKKSIENREETIKNHQTELTAKLAKQREQYENQLSTLKNNNENALNKCKHEFENLIKNNEDKLLAIVEGNKQLDEFTSKIYEKYKFLNDERRYDNNFDLGQIIEAAYFFNSATKNYVLKLPELFKQRSNVKFKSQGILSKSDKANLDYLMTNNIADNVLVADEDSVKRNQDLSKFITDLRKKLVEAKVKDVSNVIIENHRIKL